jgi:hypothetical protein
MEKSENELEDSDFGQFNEPRNKEISDKFVNSNALERDQICLDEINKSENV